MYKFENDLPEDKQKLHYHKTAQVIARVIVNKIVNVIVNMIVNVIVLRRDDYSSRSMERDLQGEKKETMMNIPRL